MTNKIKTKKNGVNDALAKHSARGWNVSCTSAANKIFYLPLVVVIDVCACPQTFCKQSAGKSLQTIAKRFQRKCETKWRKTVSFFSFTVVVSIASRSSIPSPSAVLYLLLSAFLWFNIQVNVSINGSVGCPKAHKFNTRSSGSNLENWSWKLLLMLWHFFCSIPEADSIIVRYCAWPDF